MKKTSREGMTAEIGQKVDRQGTGTELELVKEGASFSAVGAIVHQFCHCFHLSLAM